MSASGVEDAAAAVLRRAVEMDKDNRKMEAMTCYTEGAGLLIDALKNMTMENTRRAGIRERAEQYMARAELLKNAVEREKSAGKFNEQIQIKADSCGHSYDALLGMLCDDTLTAVAVDDAYIKAHHQLINFTRFCEFLVRRAPKLRHITLNTTREAATEQRQLQVRALTELADSLQRQRAIVLTVDYSTTLHDREIRFNNGWIVKIGRGLDYFKKAPSNYALGAWDMTLRPCHETTVDIMHRSRTTITKQKSDGR